MSETEHAILDNADSTGDLDNIVPFATVNGQAILELPADLYIPPDAMTVLLQTFEGPFDLLLYLIRKQNIDILDIPIAAVTKQYMEYIDLMEGLSLTLAAEYLLMAAILAEIKSRMLLPKPADPEASEEDPRTELVRRLQEYERYKKAAEELNELPRLERDFFIPDTIDTSHIPVIKPLPRVLLPDLLDALKEVLKRSALSLKHAVKLDAISVREKMSHILDNLQDKEHVLFTQLFNENEGKFSIVVTFLAMLELLKQGLIEFVQAGAFSPIYLNLKK
jgi:segregation and condensation protein A